MLVIILGAGRSGTSLARRLARSNHDVVLVDPKASEVAEERKINALTIDGVIIDIDVLREAGIENADAVCALSDSENQNLMASQIAKRMFNVNKVIARIFDAHGVHLFDKAGIVTISSPEVTVDAFIYEIETANHEMQMDYNNRKVMGENIHFTLHEADPEIVGCKIRDIEDTEARHVFAIIRKDRMMLSLPDIKIEKGDKLILASL